MGLYRRKRNGKVSPILWMSFTVDGKQYRRSTETTDEKQADAIYSKVKVQIVEGKWFDIDQAKNRTFDELMETYFTKISDKHSTLSRKKDALPHLKEVFAGLTLDNITSSSVDDYKKKRLDEGAADSTILNEVRLLSHAFNTVQWSRSNPVKYAKRIRLEAEQIDRWLTAKEEAKLLPKTEGKLNGALEDIVILDLNTGMSQEEILKLDWSQIDLFRKTLTTGREKTEKRRSKRRGSNGSDGSNKRTIPLNATACALLKKRAKGGMSGYIFCDENEKMIKADKLKKAFKKAVKESGIAHFRFHDLRHTFATRLVQAGVDLYKVAKLLGHKEISTTQRYAHHYPESLRSGVEILDREVRRKRDRVERRKTG
jgi:integrase